MKITSLIGLALIFTLTGLGQKVYKFNTKDLINISEKFGFDSVYNSVGTWPIVYLDPNTAFEIAQNIQNQYSKNIDNYLIDYALRTISDTLILPIMLNHFENELLLIHGYKPNNNMELPEINIDLINVFLNFPPKESESILIKYYNEWLKKSSEYRPQYLKGIEKKRIKLETRLTYPYETCNYNCFIILLGLKKLNSSFFDDQKLDSHRKIISTTRQISLIVPNNLTNFSPTEKSMVVMLTKKYRSIGEIEFNAEQELEKEFSKFSESYLLTNESKLIEKCCFQKVLYSGKSGYLQLRCSLGGMAGKSILYRIELINETLIFYYISSSVS